MDKKNIRKALFSEAKVTNTYSIFNPKCKAVSLVHLALFTFLTRLTFTIHGRDFTIESSGNSGVGHNRNGKLKHLIYTISTCTSSSVSIDRTSAEKVTSKRRMTFQTMLLAIITLHATECRIV